MAIIDCENEGGEFIDDFALENVIKTFSPIERVLVGYYGEKDEK